MDYVEGGGGYGREWVVGRVGRGVGLGVWSEIQMDYVLVERADGGGGGHGRERVADGVGREMQMVDGGGGGRYGKGWVAGWVRRGVGLGVGSGSQIVEDGVGEGFGRGRVADCMVCIGGGGGGREGAWE
jgi:hypothetical protein